MSYNKQKCLKIVCQKVFCQQFLQCKIMCFMLVSTNAFEFVCMCVHASSCIIFLLLLSLTNPPHLLFPFCLPPSIYLYWLSLKGTVSPDTYPLNASRHMQSVSTYLQNTGVCMWCASHINVCVPTCMCILVFVCPLYVCMSGLIVSDGVASSLNKL